MANAVSARPRQEDIAPWANARVAHLSSLSTSAASAGGADGSGGKVHDFHRMTPTSAGQRLSRIYASKELKDSARSVTEWLPTGVGSGPGDVSFGLPSSNIPGIKPVNYERGPGASPEAEAQARERIASEQEAEKERQKQQQGSGSNQQQPGQNQQVPGSSQQQVPPPAQQQPAQQQPAPQQPPNQAAPVQNGDGATAPDQSGELPKQMDPAVLRMLPSLAPLYNPDGTLKTPEQQKQEATTRDILSLPHALAENQTGVTPLGGGGTIEKTIVATGEGVYANYDVNLSDGTTLNAKKTGPDVEELSNGGTATTMSMYDAINQAGAELAGSHAQNVPPEKRPPRDTSGVFASSVGNPGDAQQILDALQGFGAYGPTIPVTVIKDKNGKVVALTRPSGDREKVLLLNAGGVSYDQQNQKLFEFYRTADGAMYTPEGHKIVEIDGQYIRVDENGVPVLPDNPFAESAGVLSSNGVRTNQPHGARLAPNLQSEPSGTGRGPTSPSATTAPYNDPLRYPVTPAGDGLYYVELPSGDLSAIGVYRNGEVAQIEEIKVPPGVKADRMYKVQGGGLLVEDANGIHWATDPGNIRTTEEIGADIAGAVVREVMWAAIGEGVGYVAVRVGAKVLPKIAGVLARNADEVVPPGAGQLADDAVPPGAGKAADDAVPPVGGQAIDDVVPPAGRAVDDVVPPGAANAANDAVPPGAGKAADDAVPPRAGTPADDAPTPPVTRQPAAPAPRPATPVTPPRQSPSWLQNTTAAVQRGTTRFNSWLEAESVIVASIQNSRIAQQIRQIFNGPPPGAAFAGVGSLGSNSAGVGARLMDDIMSQYGKTMGGLGKIFDDIGRGTPDFGRIFGRINRGNAGGTATLARQPGPVPRSKPLPPKKKQTLPNGDEIYYVERVENGKIIRMDLSRPKPVNHSSGYNVGMPSPVKNADGSWTINLRMHNGWDKADFDLKALYLQNLGKQDKLILTASNRDNKKTAAWRLAKQREIFNNAKSQADLDAQLQKLDNQQIDHAQDLQLGGLDRRENMWALDSATNHGMGGQISSQLDFVLNAAGYGAKIRVNIIP